MAHKAKARNSAVALALAAILAAVPLPANTQEGPPRVPDPMRAWMIVPPGQDGNVTADELAAEDFGPHYSDQLEMYAGLPEDDTITAKDMSKHFHPMQFGPGADIERTYSPMEGVTVYRDSLGIPHIYADTTTNASFALGYVAAEDRLWQMDVFRHAARGTLAELAGPGEDNERLNMDIDTRREGYTEEEMTAMFDSFDDKFGTVGKTLQTGLQAYADGVNAYIDELKTNPAMYPQRPVEYEATGNPFPEFPTEWLVNDTLYLIVLQLREFGETAGFEFENAGLYSHLVDKLGARLGKKVFADLLNQNDRRSYTSINPAQRNFHAQDLGTPKAAAIAIPDKAEEQAARVAQREASRSAILAGMGFQSPASNAILVAAKESETGNPLEFGAPQVGYSVPQFFIDIDVHAGDVHFRGPAVPGASALIPLGRGLDYAWSLTTGFSDAVDVRAELLCEPGGGDATVDSNGYMFKGKCKEMTSRTETFIAKPIPSDPAPPAVEERTFYRTRHGPVFQRGAVKGKPVAFVKERFFWKKELDTLPQFYHWNATIDSVGDFQEAASKFTMSLNTYYADARHIGYFHMGFLPVRTRGVNPALPSWGTGQWEFKGRRSFSLQPKIVDPKQGWLVNWNNKPAAGWDNHDNFKWGAVQRVQLLADGMRKLTRGPRKANLAEITDLIADSATRDVRAVYLGPKMLRWTAGQGLDGRAADAFGLVKKWINAGSHRVNKNRDENEDKGPALLLFDSWYDTLVHKVFDDELGEPAYEIMGADSRAPISDYNPTTGSSFFFDFSSYLQNLFSSKTRRSYARNYCDNLETKKSESCVDMVANAFVKALAKLTEEHGEDMSAWTIPAENLIFGEHGAGSVPPIPWQNRGTHNHAVEILRDL